MKKPNIILLDLETLPIVHKHIGSLGDYNSDRFGLTLKAENNSIICFGYKVLGDKKAKCVNSWDFKSGRENINDDTELLKYMSSVLKDADAVVTHNGNNFDLKVIRTRLALKNLPPLPDVPSIDTCSLSKSKFYFIKNRLDYIAQNLGTARKLKHSGWDMWQRLAMSAYQVGPGVPSKAQVEKDKRVMSKYCAQDVEALHEIYNLMRSHAKSIPNFQWFTDGRVCPGCGSTKVHKHSLKASKTGPKQRYQCQDCGTLSYMDNKGRLNR